MSADPAPAPSGSSGCLKSPVHSGAHRGIWRPPSLGLGPVSHHRPLSVPECACPLVAGSVVTSSSSPAWVCGAGALFRNGTLLTLAPCGVLRGVLDLVVVSLFRSLVPGAWLGGLGVRGASARPLLAHGPAVGPSVLFCHCVVAPAVSWPLLGPQGSPCAHHPLWAPRPPGRRLCSLHTL